ncbi:AI-2E family transporter [Sphingomonas quercus]|uniref:AI-2E family transporter n=1 Tax=Sphingomonas quercus TaxID=2842451 RepID=A0ABS6BNZ2_9SPHN|nr:AI-2E family transporter [Sphingomonas quercus]MBU3079116.1 AI-2E family transporter [Sphingomonas quercus]
MQMDHGQERLDDRPVAELPAVAVTRVAEPQETAAAVAHRRERLLAALTLIAGIGLVVALPFALRTGAEFFLPVTAALVVAVALVPLLEWLERRRVPSGAAAFLCVGFFLGLVNVAIASIIVPASGWVALLPSRIGQVKSTIKPIMEIYQSLDRFINETTRQVAISRASGVRTVTLETPNSLLDLVASSAPHAIVQMFFGTLVIYFFLAGWTAMRRRTITSRGSFSSAMATARVIQDVVDATSSYLTTITLINLVMGVAVAMAMWAIGMPTPLMWGGMVALLNYVPYLGPIAAALLLALGGLMTFPDPWSALLPAACFVAIHLVEANAITPTIVGKKLTINPLLILVALSFWGWVWGTTGALLAVPLLIILKTVLDAAGKPDIAGFLFEDGTLARPPHDEAERDEG